MGLRLIVLLWLLSAMLVKTTDNVDYLEMFGTSEENNGLPSTNTSVSSGTQPCTLEPRCRCQPYKKSGVMVDCSYAGLHEIPHGFPNNTVRLELRGNKIQDIKDGIFAKYSIMTFLDLSENNLTKLGSGAFLGLERLSSLLLSNNKIRYSNTTIQAGVFQPLHSLQILRIQQNLSDFHNDETYPNDEIEQLKKLTYLSMDGLPNTQFTSGFCKLSKLEQLRLDGKNGRCSLSRIRNNMFVSLPQLKQLWIKNCDLKMVEKGSFSKLRHLTDLDLSFNMELEFKCLENISFGLNLTNITKVNLTKIHHTFGDCTRLDATCLKELSKTGIKQMILDSNRLSYIDADAVKYIPMTLQLISLKDNKLIVGKYVVEILLHIHKVFQNLKIFILSQQRLSHNVRELLSQQRLSHNVRELLHSDDLFQNQNYSQQTMRHLLEENSQNLAAKNLHLWKQTPNLGSSMLQRNAFARNFEEFYSLSNTSINSSSNIYCSNCIPYRNLSVIILPLPLQLRFLDLSELNVRTRLKVVCFCEPNSLQTVKLNINNLWKWQGPFVGLTNLTSVNLAENACQYLSPISFHNMPNLKKLNASNNFLGLSLASDVYGVTFSQLPKLKELCLSENRIRHLTQSIFRGLVGLERLFLASNQIIKINVDFNHMTALHYVDLHDNLLEEVGESTRGHFDKMADLHNITVNLSKNKFKCSCKHLEFIKWISKTRVEFEYLHTYTCTFDNDSTGNLTFAANIYDTLSKECANYLMIVLAASAAILLALILAFGGILYRYRWDLRYMYYSTKFRLKGYTPVNVENGEFDFDVFVSYADRDRGFVRQYLVSELEKKRGVRLLVHDRDFQAGNFVSENIMQAITTSRKTLIIMTRGFLNSSWCRYEMNMARMEAIKTGRNILCVLMKEEVPMTGLPLEIIDLIRQQTYVDIPDDAEHQEPFWNRLKASLME